MVFVPLREFRLKRSSAGVFPEPLRVLNLKNMTRDSVVLELVPL